MIWHIFKKDLRLLRRLVIAVAAIDWLNAGLLIYGGPFGRESAVEFAFISNGVLPAISLLGLAFLAIAVVQQDRFRARLKIGSPGLCRTTSWCSQNSLSSPCWGSARSSSPTF